MTSPYRRGVMTRSLVVGLALVVLTAACGGRPRSDIALRITVTKSTASGRAVEHFTLGCRPTSGTLPLGSRVCRDIARHRQAMLAPRAQRSTCGGIFRATVDVTVLRGWNGGGFSASPGCGWPGGTPASIYLAASVGDSRALALMEPRLRCEDDPAFFVEPTPWASVTACTHGLWTSAAERAIREAETSRQLSALDARHLFPADPGARRCRIHGGGPAPGRVFHGTCGVRLTGPPSAKTVHFVEAWSVDHRVFRHRWSVRGATVVAQSGAAPPQLWS